MKKLLLSALLAVTVAVSSFAADASRVNAAAVNSFRSLFKRASDVSWSSGKDFVKATFILNSVRTEALYTPEGEFIGTNVGITLDELPVKAKRSFAKRFDGFTVKEAIRFEGNEEGAFYIAAESDKESVILKVSDDSQVSLIKSTKK